MPTNTLTDNDCRRAEPRSKAYKLFDGNGLYLWISPKGARVWRQDYRFGGKKWADTVIHGAYPLITLRAAREKRDEVLRLLAAGQDPKAGAKLAAPVEGVKSITLGVACDTYWGGKKDISDGYRENAKRGLELHLADLWKRDMRTIEREEFLRCLNAMDAAGKHVYVRKVRMWASQVWHWAVEQKYADTNIPDTINPKRAFGKAKVDSFPALHERDMPALWRRIAVEGDLQSVLAARMLAHTWVRTKEMRFMEWGEVDAFGRALNIEASGAQPVAPDPDKEWTWEIPAGKMKRAKAHLVPLPRQARLLLLKLWARRRPGGKYVFTAEHRLDRPISDSAVLMLLYRIGYKGAMTGHGFRSVGSTWANERGYNKDWVERQLAHTPEDKVRAAYNKAQFLDGRRKLLQGFSDWLDTLDAAAVAADSASPRELAEA
jgi:integrase